MSDESSSEHEETKKPKVKKSRKKSSIPMAKPDQECIRSLIRTFQIKYAPILRKNKCQLFASHEEKKNKLVIPMLETLNMLPQEDDEKKKKDDHEEKEKKEEAIEPIFIQRKLHAGDFWIRLNGKLVYLIERKSISDLSGSIGARMRQQKFKCKRMPIPHSRVIYLTEGKKPARVFMKDSTTLMGATVDIIVRDRMLITHQPNEEATFMWLVKMLIKVCEFVIGTCLDTESARESHREWTEELKRQPVCPLDFNPLGAFDPDTDYPDKEDGKELGPKSVYLTREELGFVESYCPDGWAEKPQKKLLNPKTFYIGILCGIPLLKAYKAASILEEFPTLLDLIGFLLDPKTTEADKISRIANLTASKNSPVVKAKLAEVEATAKPKKSKATKSKSDKRRLGPALAKKIYHMLLNKVFDE